MNRVGHERSVLWLGRLALVPDRAAEPFAPSLAIRVWTDGRAPQADDPFEVIEDPFADPTLDPYTTAVAANAQESSLGGSLGQHDFACPVRPRKLICVGRNYRAHAAELGNEVPTRPMLFTKCASSVLPAGQTVPIYPEIERIDMEAELVMVVGRAGVNLSREASLSHMAGLTLGNDISARDYQKRDKHWTHAKGLDGFAPLGPMIRMLAPEQRTAEYLADLRIQGVVDGQLCQDAPISAMVFDVATLLEAASRRMTLYPGDVIYTGTPQGVPQLRAGMQLEVRCQGLDLGVLANPTA